MFVDNKGNEIHVGDKVICNCYGTAKTIGIIHGIKVNREMLIQFPGWTHGHSGTDSVYLDGRDSGQKGSKEFWWCFPEGIELVKEESFNIYN